MSWGFTAERRLASLTRPLAVGALAAGLGLTLAGPVSAAGREGPSPTVSVIVGGHAGGVAAVTGDVDAVGGHVTLTLGIINAVSATVPANHVRALESNADVAWLTPDSSGHLDSIGSYDPTSDPNSLYTDTGNVGAQNFWKKGYTGQGVDVALIDSGVAPVNGLSAAGKVLNGPDISFDSQAPQLQYLDGFGHGTHMAGIIAGRDNAAVAGQYAGDTNDFIGVAPDARIVNVKVADSGGNADVSQVIAGIDWIVQHRSDPGMNVRVINLSYGTDSVQPYVLDPLAYAAEVAWNNGIVVVAAAGNFGSSAVSLNDPAYDPYVIAVGAADTNSSFNNNKYSVASFSSWGTAQRPPDLVAPGVHVASLRDPGSSIDLQYGATATVATRFFRGSGSSQATAIVSGAAALVLSQHPTYTPDMVKTELTATAAPLVDTPVQAQGSGLLNLSRALNGTPLTFTRQSYTPSTGTGTLEGSRGSLHVVANGVTLSGEMDIMGKAVSTTGLAQQEASLSAWNGGTFNGSTWSGGGWSAGGWSSGGWSGGGWSGGGWSSGGWSGSQWSGGGWSGGGWSGGGWSGGGWSGASTGWSGGGWSGGGWSGGGWSGGGWSGGGWSGGGWSAGGWSDAFWS